jgi:hypothetical protein
MIPAQDCPIHGEYRPVNSTNEVCPGCAKMSGADKVRALQEMGRDDVLSMLESIGIVKDGQYQEPNP